MDETWDWDCVVVGGGGAGLSAALVLGRARRRTLLVDAGGQSNGVAHGIGGVLGHDGRPPAELYAAGRAELAGYPAVRVVDGRVAGARAIDGGFEVDLDDGSRPRTRRLLLATGMDYRPPGLPGIAPRWGRSVFHCPFCHGWEVRDRPLCVLAPDAMGAERAVLLAFWSDDVTLLTDGPLDLDPGVAERLRAAGIAVDQRPVAGLLGDEPDLSAIAFEDGSRRPCGGLLVPVTLHQRGDLARSLGAATRPGPMAEEVLDLGPVGATSVPGLFAAGDAGADMPSLSAAIASGAAAAAGVVHSLMG